MEAEEVKEVEQTINDDQQESEPEQKEELVIQLGEEEIKPEEDDVPSDKGWVKELRKSYRETAKQNKELQRRLEELEASRNNATKEVAITKKPVLSDFDYDTEKFEAALVEYHDSQRKENAKKQEHENQLKQQQEDWNRKLEKFAEGKKRLGREDFEDAEILLTKAFSQTQQGIIIQGSDDPALLAYAIGKNPARAEELAKIKDPVAFAFAVAKLEGQLKVTSKKAPPEPEKVVRSSAKAGSSDNTLERLRANAEKTGDYSQVVAYRQKMRSKQK